MGWREGGGSSRWYRRRGQRDKGQRDSANCTGGLGLLSVGVAGHELILLGIDQLLQDGLHDGHHHGGGGRVGEPHGEQGGTAHEAEQQPGRQGGQAERQQQGNPQLPVSQGSWGARQTRWCWPREPWPELIQKIGCLCLPLALYSQGLAQSKQ